MHIMTLPAIAGLALAGFSQVAIAADNGPPPGTNRPDQDNALPMDRHGVIRPPEPTTRDPNQAEVPGTRDNPNIMAPNVIDRDRRFEHDPAPPAPPTDIDRDKRR